MVIDFHTHIFSEKIAAKAVGNLAAVAGIQPVMDGTAAGLSAYMKQCGVDRAVVLPVMTKASQTKRMNEWFASVASDKLIPFGGIHPENEDYKERIADIKRLGMKGVKMHPEYQNFEVDDEKMYPLYEEILKQDLILVIHSGEDAAYTAPFRCTPKKLRTMVRAMGGGKIVAAHFGAHKMWDDVEELLVGEDLYFDTSMGTEYYTREQFLRIVRGHGVDKILFATDSPWSDAKTELEHIRAAGLTEAETEQILCGNARTLLKL